MVSINSLLADTPFSLTSCLFAPPQLLIVERMGLLAGILIILVVGLVLRRVLGLGSEVRGRASRTEQLSPAQLAIYTPFSIEVETQAAIISISLNDAIEERDAGHPEIAWRLVTLSASEWQRVAEIITALLDALKKNLPNARAVIPYRGMVVRRFKSQTMMDFLRMYEFLEKVIFRSRMRFHLQIHTLRRAAATLTAEFSRVYQYGERTEDRPPELWQRLDIYSHDFDLVTKESLMAFRALLVCLPSESLVVLAADLEPVLRRGVRTASVPANF